MLHVHGHKGSMSLGLPVSLSTGTTGEVNLPDNRCLIIGLNHLIQE
jgi:hypothetical protein